VCTRQEGVWSLQQRRERADARDMRTSTPTKNPSSMLRKSVEAERRTAPPPPQRSSPQVTPAGLMIALVIAIAIGTAAVMVT
jgi:hypothetical protein